MINKQHYIAPEVEMVVVSLEQPLMNNSINSVARQSYGEAVTDTWGDE